MLRLANGDICSVASLIAGSVAVERALTSRAQWLPPQRASALLAANTQLGHGIYDALKP